ncbi:MAG: septal ring lytic transglycosylase RlpA family protein [Flavobacterium sp.]|nr:septal ring lytic transglycosylase RlpA family protein [Flavobacterium sp.]
MKKYKYTILSLFFIAFIVAGFSERKPFILAATPPATDSIKVIVKSADTLLPTYRLFKKNAHASYYADKFNGRRTASGRKFDNSKYTAAHRKLPFGTMLRVTNESSGLFVDVEVTDRGPFTKGREIDLSKKAFMDIARNKNRGALQVTIEIIE